VCLIHNYKTNQLCVFETCDASALLIIALRYTLQNLTTFLCNHTLHRHIYYSGKQLETQKQAAVCNVRMLLKIR